MAQRTQIILIDDFDGTEIEDGEGQSITFTWSGIDYSIDLTRPTPTNSRRPLDRTLRKLSGSAGARAAHPGRKSRSSSASTTSGGQVDTKAVRAWAASNGPALTVTIRANG